MIVVPPTTEKKQDSTESNLTSESCTTNIKTSRREKAVPVVHVICYLLTGWPVGEKTEPYVVDAILVVGSLHKFVGKPLFFFFLFHFIARMCVRESLAVDLVSTHDGLGLILHAISGSTKDDSRWPMVQHLTFCETENEYRETAKT